MKQKTEEFRRLFNLPETETVIQDYACSYGASLGRLYVSQNYVCFHSKILNRNETIPFRKVANITVEKTLIFSSIGIKLQDNPNPLWFSNFVHLDEAYKLIYYLWKNPPSVVSVNVNDEILPGIKKDGRLSSAIQSEIDNTNTTNNQNDQTQEQMTTPQVDVATSKRALRLAQEAVQLGSDSLNELSQQGEALDRIETNLNMMEYQLNQSDRLLSGIESLPAYIGNAIRKNKQPPPPEPVKNDHSVKLKKQPIPNMDIEILCKNKDDSFTPALLRLSEDTFSCIDPETEKPLQKEMVWPYTAIDSIVMRARHQHMDVRFKVPTMERFRLMSSYLQVITNELFLRAQEKKSSSGPPVKVVFEPGVPEFAYGNPRISMQPTRSRGTAGFIRPESQKRTSELLSSNAPKKLKDDLDETDKDLDNISRLVGDLNSIAVTMGDTIKEQTEHLERLNAKADQVTAHIEQNNRRMDKILED
jgi:hypothetical protein